MLPLRLVTQTSNTVLHFAFAVIALSKPTTPISNIVWSALNNKGPSLSLHLGPLARDDARFKGRPWNPRTKHNNQSMHPGSGVSF